MSSHEPEIRNVSDELRKTVRDMADDERGIFLEFYLEGNARNIETAKKKTAIRLPRQRKANAEAARLKLVELDAETAPLRQKRAEWFNAHPGEFVPLELSRARDRIEQINQECERLKSVIQMGEL
jgi:hypothetical protein